MKTNKKIVQEIMNLGPMAEMFVIDALTKMAEAASKSKREDYSDFSIVNPEAWIETAKEIKKKLDEEYK